MPGERAVFLDRDGVLNAMIRVGDELDSPLRVEHVRLLPGVGSAIRQLNEAGLPVVIVSNQPVVAKQKTTFEELEQITKTIVAGLQAEGGKIDGIYYCLHHPWAAVDELRGACECRKPGPGLIQKAAEEMQLDPARSFMVGDRVTDIQAGRRAGCRTVLVDEARRVSASQENVPEEGQADHIAPDLPSAVRWILGLLGERELSASARGRA